MLCKGKMTKSQKSKLLPQQALPSEACEEDPQVLKPTVLPFEFVSQLKLAHKMFGFKLCALLSSLFDGQKL